MDTPNIDKYIGTCDTSWMSNEDFLHILTDSIQQGIINKTELENEFSQALANEAFDWVEKALSNGLFKEYSQNPIEGKVITNDILIETINRIYWDDIPWNLIPSNAEIQNFANLLEELEIKPNDTIEQLLDLEIFKMHSFCLKTKMKFYLGAKELRNQDVVYFLKGIGGDMFFPNAINDKEMKKDQEFIIEYLRKQNGWIDHDKIVQALKYFRNSKLIDSHYISKLDYRNYTYGIRHHRFEMSSHVIAKDST